MVKRILALTDLSENSQAGLELAESLARRFHAAVVGGYAHTRLDLVRDTEEARRLAEWARKDDEDHLRALCAKIIEPGRLTGIEIVDAPDAREGVEMLVARVKPDLVCMATRGRTGLPHLLLGSVAEHTLRTARVPVVVTRGGPFPLPGTPLRVLLGLDLHHDPQAAAREAAALLAPQDELILAHVVESPGYTPPGLGLPREGVGTMVEAARKRLLAVDLGENGPRLRVEVRHGHPADTLLEMEESLRPQLVVVRTHGRRGFDRMMLGSVAEHLARRCRAAVLVLPKLD
jgi:nucleotide-binding universal stress UspA family protein